MGRFRESRYGLIALGISVADVTFIWGGLAAVYALGLWGRAPLWLLNVFRVAYLAGIAGLAFGVVGLIKGSGRIYAALAVVLFLISLGIGGLIFAI
jgi:hypothetical protein